jgi:hypothetical protein
MKWRLPGPHAPAQAVRRPVSWSFGAGCEGPGLFVPHMDPLDCTTVDGVNDPVQRVAHDPVASFHAGSLQRFDQYVRYAFAHCGPSLSNWAGLITDEPHRDLKKEGLRRTPRDVKKSYLLRCGDFAGAQCGDLERLDQLHPRAFRASS